jgi:Lrp/AsnC family transcriptional regulator of ectoine degradation
MLRLDARDLEILRVLSVEGRISKADLARRINLSTSPAWERLTRLEAAGIIEGYRAQIALKAIAPHLVVFVTLELDRHTADSFQRFEAQVQDHPEITGVWALGGGFDYLMQVIARDVGHYQALIDQLLADGAGIARYYTYVVTKPVKSSPPPFDLLMRPQAGG